MRGSVTIATAALLAACGQDNLPVGTPNGAPPAFVISDAVHGDGHQHFFFLPPMVPNPQAGGVFDSDLAPVVRICALAGSGCGIAPQDLIATYTTTSGPGSETVRVQAAAENYIVNWHTDQFALNPDRNYRILVSVGGAEIGFADVDVVSSGKELKNVATGEYIPLLDGRTLPIKFRIEQGMVVSISVTPNPVEVDVGETTALTATVRDGHGNVLAGVPLSWTSGAPSIATVNGTGTVTGVSEGTATVTAAFSTMSGSAEVHVAPLPPSCGPPPASPIGFWVFDEGMGSTSADLSGFAHTAVLQGAPGWVAGATGMGGALSFDVATHLVNIGSFLSPGVGALTVGVWVNPSSFSNAGDIGVGGVSGPRIISATDGGGWSLGHASGTGQIQIELRGITSFVLTTQFPLAQWSHVAFAYGGGSIRTYLNGVLVDSRAAPIDVVQQASSCTFIGNEPEGCSRQTNGNFAWQGQIDELIVYGRALTDDEIQAIYHRCGTK